MKTKSFLDSIPETSRNQAVIVGESMMRHADERTAKEIREFRQTEEGKKFIEKYRVK